MGGVIYSSNGGEKVGCRLMNSRMYVDDCNNVRHIKFDTKFGRNEEYED